MRTSRPAGTGSSSSRSTRSAPNSSSRYAFIASFLLSASRSRSPAEYELGVVAHPVGRPGRVEDELHVDALDAVDFQSRRGDVVLDHRRDRATHTRERVRDPCPVADDVDLVDEAERDDVDAQLRILDSGERGSDCLRPRLLDLTRGARHRRAPGPPERRVAVLPWGPTATGSGRSSCSGTVSAESVDRLASRYCSRSTFRRSLPVSVRGSSSSHTTSRGRLSFGNASIPAWSRAAAARSRPGAGTAKTAIEASPSSFLKATPAISATESPQASASVRSTSTVLTQRPEIFTRAF